MSLLYEAEVKEVAVSQILSEQQVPPEEFVVQLLEGVEGHAKEIDRLISAHALNWSFQRLGKVDKAILRLSVYEMCFGGKVPMAVAMDEAVELAKAYSTAESGSFVNGVLSGIAERESTGELDSKVDREPDSKLVGMLADKPVSALDSEPASVAPARLVLKDGTIFEGEMLVPPKVADGGAGGQTSAYGNDSLSEAGVTSGEVVFNTALCGYQEILTDPSYAGQIITFTSPHIGNYGVTPLDVESVGPGSGGAGAPDSGDTGVGATGLGATDSDGLSSGGTSPGFGEPAPGHPVAKNPAASPPACRGIIVRDISTLPSNWRATENLGDYLLRLGVPVLFGIDTRRLTLHIRQQGAMAGAFGTANPDQLLEVATSEKGTDGVDLVSTVTCAEAYSANELLASDVRRGIRTGIGPASTQPSAGPAQRSQLNSRSQPGTISTISHAQPYKSSSVQPPPWRIAALDFGIKRTILRQLCEFGDVTVLPATAPLDEIMSHDPHGIFLSNGPGDPTVLRPVCDVIAELLEKLPVFGICLGHQLLAQALGAAITKLPFGHHGGNHPVQNCATGEVEITSQNHNFVVAEPSSSSDFFITHRNLNDGTVEGLSARQYQARGVQYHPEAGPGPHDSRYLFAEFRQMLEAAPKR